MYLHTRMHEKMGTHWFDAVAEYISSLVGLYVDVRAAPAQTHKWPVLFMNLSSSGVPLPSLLVASVSFYLNFYFDLISCLTSACTFPQFCLLLSFNLGFSQQSFSSLLYSAPLAVSGHEERQSGTSAWPLSPVDQQLNPTGHRAKPNPQLIDGSSVGCLVGLFALEPVATKNHYTYIY